MSLLHRILDFVCPDAALRLPRFSPWAPLDSAPSVPRFDARSAAELAEHDALMRQTVPSWPDHPSGSGFAMYDPDTMPKGAHYLGPSPIDSERSE